MIPRKIDTWLAHLDSARQAQRIEIHIALTYARGNITRAAERLKMCRAYLTKRLVEFDLQAFARELRVAAGARKSGRGRPPL